MGDWITHEQYSVIAILGIGGIGKTTIAAKGAEKVRKHFEYIFWRSLHNAPPIEYFLRQCIQCFSEQHSLDLSEAFEEQLLLLVKYMREHRCLLVLDNVEAILQEYHQEGRYRDGYQGYGRLIQCLGEISHRSCLLLTSREKPREISLLAGIAPPVRTLYLQGIGSDEGRAMLKEKELLGSDEHWSALVEMYAGNPLALSWYQRRFGRFLKEILLTFYAKKRLPSATLRI